MSRQYKTLRLVITEDSPIIDKGVKLNKGEVFMAIQDTYVDKILIPYSGLLIELYQFQGYRIESEHVDDTTYSSAKTIIDGNYKNTQI